MNQSEYAFLNDVHKKARKYLEDLETRRVAPDPAALGGLADFEGLLPETGAGTEATLELLDRVGSPATLATAGGRFFGMVVGGALPATVGANWLATAWDQIAFNETTSPVATKLESVAGEWLLDILGLPGESAVNFVTGATMANLTGLAAARNFLYGRLDYDVDKRGLQDAPPLRVIVSDEVHVSLTKALGILGLGRERVERVGVDEQGRIRPEALPALDENCILCLQAGNVNSGASDPFAELVPRAQAAGAWVHVDGAFGLWAAASSKHKELVNGVAGADSWAVDGHKWLNTPYDCGISICRHKDPLFNTMATQAAYLTADTIAPKDLVPEFSRRARSVDVWAALYSLGRKGIDEMIGGCCRHAKTFEAGLREMGFRIHNEVVLNQVVASLGKPEELAEIVRQVQTGGDCWFGTTQWRGEFAIRISVSSWRTTEADVATSLAAVKNAKENVLGS